MVSAAVDLIFINLYKVLDPSSPVWVGVLSFSQYKTPSEGLVHVRDAVESEVFTLT
jgi:hypothetical protein